MYCNFLNDSRDSKNVENSRIIYYNKFVIILLIGWVWVCYFTCSIITPVHNSEAYLEATIKSVLAQSYGEFEFILIDDHSTDHSTEILQHYADLDNRIRLLTNENNLGVAESRNKGVANAKGKYVAFLDSDDLWKANKLEIQLEFAIENKYQFTYTSYRLIDENSAALNITNHAVLTTTFTDLLKCNVIGCSTVLGEKKLFESHPMPLNFYHEDYATWLSILKDCEYAYGLDEPLTLYRFMKGSRSSNKFRSAINVWQIYRNYMGMGHIKSSSYFLKYIFGKVKKYSEF